MSGFRAIDITGFEPCEIADQQAPVLQWVEVERCVIDGRYQRDITAAGRRAIQRIAREWSWSKYQPLICAPTPDGRFAVVDGQHRAHAAKVAGLNMLPAMIVPMTPAEQAAAFGAVNMDRIRPNRAAIFKAKLVAGDPVAIAASAAVEAAGCRLMTYIPTTTQRQPGDVFSHSLICRMVAQGEGEVVTVGLRAIRDSATGNEPRTDAYASNLWVYDGRVLAVWLPVLAMSQRYLRIADLADAFDEIDWITEFDNAAALARRDGTAARPLVAKRVETVLRARVQQVAA